MISAQVTTRWRLSFRCEVYVHSGGENNVPGLPDPIPVRRCPMTVGEITLVVSLIGIILSAFSLGYRVGRGSKK